MLAAILDGPLKGRFTVRHYDDYDVSDGVFLPDGDMLLLERRFDFAHGIGMRLRRIAGGDIKPGAVVDGTVIFEANADEQIDNMEGIDAFRAEDGTIHLIMVSDDNHSILQAQPDAGIPAAAVRNRYRFLRDSQSGDLSPEPAAPASERS